MEATTFLELLPKIHEEGRGCGGVGAFSCGRRWLEMILVRSFPVCWTRFW